MATLRQIIDKELRKKNTGIPQARIFKKGNKVLIENIRVEAQDVLKTILEGVSKQQKIAGQKAMSYEAIDPIKKVRQYLIEKWNNTPKLTKEQFEQKKEEFKRLAVISKAIIETYKVMSEAGVDFNKTESKVRETTGAEPGGIMVKGGEDRTGIKLIIETRK